MSAPPNRWLPSLVAGDAPLGREAVWTFAGRIAWVAIEFLLSLLLARLLGLAGYGAYAFAISVAALLGGPAALGFDRLLIREVAIQKSGAHWARMRGLLRMGNGVSLGFSTLLAAAIMLAAPWLAGRAAPEAIDALRIAALLVPVVAISRQRQAALQGLGRVALGQSPEMLLQPLAVLLLVGLNLVLGLAPWTGPSAVAMQLVAATLAGIAGALLLRRSLPRAAAVARPEYATRAWAAAAAPLLLLVLTTMALNHMDTVLLGALRGTDEAGAYRAASQIAALVVLPMTAINMAVAPRLAGLYTTGDTAGMQRIAALAVRIGAALGLPIAVMIWTAGRPLLGLFGAEFAAAYLPLVVLTAAYVFNTMTGTAGYVLIMTRQSRLAASLFGGAVLLGLGAQLWLIPRLGGLGAAIGTSLALLVLGIGLVLAAAKTTGIRAGLWQS